MAADTQLSLAWRRRSIPLIVGIALFVIAAILALPGVRTGVAPDLMELMGIAAVSLGNGAAGFMMVRGSRQLPSDHARAWRRIGSGFLLAGTGVVGLAVASFFIEIPTFGPFDLVFFAAYCWTFWGLFSLPNAAGDSLFRIRLGLDGAIGAVSLVVLLWVWFVGDIYRLAASGDLWGQIAGITYPSLDIAGIVAIMVLFLRRNRLRFDLRLFFVAVGFIGQASADLSYLSNGLGQNFGDAPPFFPLFMAATACYLIASSMTDISPPDHEFGQRPQTWWPLIGPYSLATGMVVALIAQPDHAFESSNGSLLFYGTLVVGALILARQGVAIAVGRKLVEKERRFLISSVSHELRTPLTAMVGFLDVLKEPDSGLEEPERDELMEVVNEQARYLARIVSDLVLLARSNTTAMDLHISTFDASDLVTQAVNSTDIPFESVSVWAPRSITVSADPDRLQQLIVNLLSNANRYGNGRVSVVVDRNGGDLVLEVHDNGPGVPKRFEHAIWDRFERGVHRLSSDVQGSGIGLAIVDAIAIAHGGTRSYSRSDKLGGACFTVTLPGRVIDEFADPKPIIRSHLSAVPRLGNVG
ncbi:MAG: HAMP domain-containing histidine kinase [Acidimicrobiia bacterium]|nr:HAMP domain-containing histidine kinase [Acidimicrobiia bacterium]